MVPILGSYAVAATIVNPSNVIRTAKSVGRLTQSVCAAFKDLGSAAVNRDSQYLRSFGWDVAKTVGNALDVPVFAAASVLNLIPIVNWIPVGWAWAKIRKHE